MLHRAIWPIGDDPSVALLLIVLLQITLRQPSEDSLNSTGISLSAVLAIRAAATVQKLTAFAFEAPEDITLYATDDLLLPLTAAAGGPGSRLRALKLVGRFEFNGLGIPNTTPADGMAGQTEAVKVVLQDLTNSLDSQDPAYSGTRSNRHGMCDVSVAPQRTEAMHDDALNMCFQQELYDEVSAARAYVCSDSRWHEPLQLLNGLNELAIVYKGEDKMITLPVDSLPASLRVMWCTRVSLVSTAARSNNVRSSSVASTSARGCMSNRSVCSNSATKCPQLQKLGLSKCQLSSPSILASRDAWELIAIGSKWPGGWAAAASAWPNLRNLYWEYDSTLSPSRNSHSLANSSLDEHTTAAVNSDTGGQDSSKALTKADAKRLELQSEAEAMLGSMLYDSSPGLTTSKVLSEILSQLKLLSAMTIIDLPWLSVEVLDSVTLQLVKKLMHINLSVPATVEYQLQVASLKAALAKKGIPVQGRQYDQRSSNECIEPRAIKHWLKQRLPWADVA